ncbi:hypothetical protein E2C01_098549 [Portunus trituberculatus]|uniref:Uncharacterized protein n=1 Tax=Portunus trituberculatus TaxID=210409 RepID=A0A5B7K796_PORTR|nr:hypothetical protein [Portunus trituberculatus]
MAYVFVDVYRSLQTLTPSILGHISTLRFVYH